MSINTDEPKISKSEDLMNYFKQTKRDFETINKTLMNNVESIDSENQRLKEAISELLSDLKEKEASLDQSQKIIIKLKEEYTKIIQEYQDLKSYTSTLEETVDANKKVFDTMTKNHQQYEKSARQNETYKVELDKLKKEVTSLKSTKTTRMNELSKREKENTDKELIIIDLKKKSENWISMIKERDRLLSQCDKRINELNSQIAEKDEQLKLMMNFSKDINNENKTNVKELTKQAVQTIKLLYNAMNNNNKNDITESVSKIELVEGESCAKVLLDSLQNNKCTFLLEDGLKSQMYIPPQAKSISKEFLLDLNFKNELIKYELMASLIRESKIVYFLEGIFNKLDILRFNSIDKNRPSYNSISNKICEKMTILKDNYEKECKNNEHLLDENKVLRDKINDMNLYIQKSKNEFKRKMISIQKKVELLEKYYQNQIKTMKIFNHNTEGSAIPKKGRDDGGESRDDTEINELLQPSQSQSYNNYNKPNQPNKHDYYQKYNNPDSVINNYHQVHHTFNQLKMCQMESIEIKALYQYNKDRPNDYRSNPFNYNQPLYYDKSDSINNKSNHNFNYNQCDYPQNTFEVNESFSNDQIKPKGKRNENEALKNEIARLKDEIASLLSELNQAQSKMNQSSLTIRNNNNTINPENNRTLDGISQLKSQIPLFQLNKIIHYFINFSKELDKIYSNTDDIVSNLSLAEAKFAQGNQDKKIKMSHLNDIFSEINKLFSILLNLLSRFSNDIKANTLSLKTIFDFLEQYIYIDASLSPRFAQLPIHLNESQTNKANNLVESSPALKSQFYELNLKVFSSSELQKYKSIYRNKPISTIIQVFKDYLKSIKLEIEDLTASNHTSILESESEGNKTQFTQSYSQYNQQFNKNNKVIHDELIQMKKNKRDIKLMNEILKHFLVVSERLNEIKSERLTDRIGTETHGELFNEIYYIFEEAFHYKIDYLSDDSIFGRRLLSKLLLNVH